MGGQGGCSSCAAHREVGQVDLGPVPDGEVADAAVEAEVVCHAGQERRIVLPGHEPGPRHDELRTEAEQGDLQRTDSLRSHA